MKYAFVLIVGVMFSMVANGAVDSRLVTKLSAGEVFEGQEFHGDLLFVGQRVTRTDAHRVDVFSNNGTVKLATIALDHNVSHMVPYGSQGVLISGIRYNKKYSSYLTTIELVGKRFKKKSVQLSSSLLVNYPATHGREVFLTNIGERKIHASARGIKKRLKTLTSGISFPGPAVFQDGFLWLIEKRGFERGNESIVKVHPKTGKILRVSGKKFLLGAEQITAMPKQHLIAISESFGEQISFYSTKTDKLVSTVSVSSQVQGIDTYGHCAVAVDGWNKQMVFVATAGPHAFEMVDIWDLSITAKGEHNPRAVTVNEATSTFFTRSYTPCGMTGTCNQYNAVYAYTDPASKVSSLCFDE